MADPETLLQVEVVFALPGDARLCSVQVLPGTTIKEAVEQSGILQSFPAVDLAHNKVGIFNKIKQLDDRVNDGDRVEIYRPLIVDPKEARRHRAEKQKIQKS
jgi:uncharacterized protein